MGTLEVKGSKFNFQIFWAISYLVIRRLEIERKIVLIAENNLYLMFNEQIYHADIVVSYIKEQKSASKCLILNGTVRDKLFCGIFYHILNISV